MAAEMLSAYYDRSCDSSELFQNLEIAEDKSFDIHLNAYDVFFLNIQQFLSGAGTADKLVEYLQAKVLEEVREIYGQYISDGENRLSSALATIYSKDKRPNKGFIFIVDEWDCVFREAMILPIKKYGTHSALNIFDEFSMIAPGKLAKYVGFTETEVRKLCRDHKLKFSEAKRWYDGYRFKKVRHVYNPKSIVDAITEEEFRSYWTSTETYEALQIYIDMDINGLREAIVSMLGNNSIKIDTGSFQNDMTSFNSRDDVLTLLVHLGYLAYDSDYGSVFIPNEEVRAEFIRAVKNGQRPELIEKYNN